MKPSVWVERTERAAQLASAHSAAAELLGFYSVVASFQERVSRQLSIAGEDPVAFFPELLTLADRFGPPIVAERARELMQRSETWGAILNENAEIQDAVDEFFARAILQPFMEYRVSLAGASVAEMRNTCPYCGTMPIVAVLRGDGGKRSLICSLCSAEWNFQRVLCPSCGEEDREKLPVLSAPEFDYIRIEACDSCKTYIKCVDLTKNGLAVPVVDEIAAVSLDVWAAEHGYMKLQPNLLGI